MRRALVFSALLLVTGCGKKSPEVAPSPGASASSQAASATSARVSTSDPTEARAAAASGKLSCALESGGGRAGPDCVTAEIACGQRIVGHTKGGVNLYNTRWYEKNTCWPATRNHDGGDERVYVFYPDKSPRFQRGETRQRVTVTFDSPAPT